MIKKLLLFFFSVLSLQSCTYNIATATPLVLEFENFGPAAMSEPLLGQSWWQWQNHGDSRPRNYDIKVVVYRSQSLNEIKAEYSVSKENLKDYRYITYSESIDYLDENIKDNILPRVTQRLENTRSKILKHFEQE